MGAVTSYLSPISVGGKHLQYVPTNAFTVNGTTYKGVITVSNTPTTFIVTQRFDGVAFHNIQINETQYLVQLPNTNSIPAEVKAIIGDLPVFLSTTNSLTKWFLISSPVPATQSNIDLLAGTNNIYITNGQQYWTTIGNKLTLTPAGKQFNFAQVTDSNIVIGSKSVNGGSGGGIELVNGTNSTNYLVFSTDQTGTVTQLSTNSGVMYNAVDNSISVSAVRTTKIGAGPVPAGDDNISIGADALAASTGADNIAIGVNALQLNTISTENIAIGNNAMQENSGSSNIGIGIETLLSNIGNNNIAIGHFAGVSYSIGEENNLVIDSLGVTGDNNIIRIGNNTKIAAYIPPPIIRQTTVIEFTGNGNLTAENIINDGIIITTGVNPIILTLPNASFITTLLNGNPRLGNTFTFVVSNLSSALTSVSPSILNPILIFSSPNIPTLTTRTFYIRYAGSQVWALY